MKDPDQRVQYSEWFEAMVCNDEDFPGKMIWSDEAQFKLNSTVNRHNCMYWAAVNLHVHVDKQVNLSVVNVWCGLSVPQITLGRHCDSHPEFLRNVP